MSASNSIGRIFVASEIENGMAELLKERLNVYVSDVAEAIGLERDAFPHVGDVDVDTDFDKWPDRQLPYIVVVSPGTNEEFDKDGPIYSGRWVLNVVAVVAGRNRAEAGGNAKAWAAAIRTCVAQHPSLNGTAESTRALAEIYDDTPDDGERTMGIAAVRFAVKVNDVMDASGLPNFTDEVIDTHPAHHADPGPDPTVEETSLTLTNTDEI